VAEIENGPDLGLHRRGVTTTSEGLGRCCRGHPWEAS
jgi:hypothetical protein